MNAQFDRANSNDPELVELESDFGPIMELLREGPHDVETINPSPDLWSRIEGELHAGGGASAVETLAVDTPSVDTRVVSLDQARERSRGRTAAILTAVAAAVALVAVPVGLSLRSGDADDVLLAAGELPVLDDAASESAVVELYDTEGNLWLDLDTTRAADDGEFLELWLIEADENGEVADLISLGQIDGSGAYDIPDDVDLDRFNVVDISVEPDDGNPEHSGDSIHRGIPTS